jgi:hypothetical protein
MGSGIGQCLQHEPNITMICLTSNHKSDTIITYNNISAHYSLKVGGKMVSAVDTAASQ